MAFMLFSIDEAIDCKYIVVRSMRQQVKKGTLIHVMDARETSDGVTVDYRVTKTKQDFTVNFNTIKEFCQWCMPSTFLAKYYDKLSYSEVIRYIKVENRTFLTFQLPLILCCLAIVWAAAMGLVIAGVVELTAGLIIGGAASVVCAAAVCLIGHFGREQMIERLYKKVS